MTDGTDGKRPVALGPVWAAKMGFEAENLQTVERSPWRVIAIDGGITTCFIAFSYFSSPGTCYSDYSARGVTHNSA